jgi:hypothetical protein
MGNDHRFRGYSLKALKKRQRPSETDPQTVPFTNRTAIAVKDTAEKVTPKLLWDHRSNIIQVIGLVLSKTKPLQIPYHFH